MKRWLFLGVAIVALLAVACGGGGNEAPTGPVRLPEGAKLSVVATTIQVAALAREVGGEDIDLHGIVPAGADAHEFEPVASDLKAIESAQVILRNGIGLDTWLDGTLKSAKNARVITVTNGVKLRQGDNDGKKIDDPHVWQDPDNDKIMVGNVAEALSAVDPVHKVAYEQRSAAYQQKLDETKVKVQAIINEIPPDGRKLVTNHDAFGYFAQAFGLKIVGAVIPSVSTEAEPSAKDTSELLDTIKREKVKAIFAESSVNPKLARTLANDAGVRIVDDLYGDSLGKPGSGAETIDGMLLANARKIADALK